jgi:Ca2+-binding EF-hand superfamily protein
MSPATFREQLKVNFGLRINSHELGALMSEFDKDGDGTIDGPEFMFRFSLLGR